MKEESRIRMGVCWFFWSDYICGKGTENYREKVLRENVVTQGFTSLGEDARGAG
jgi:hypothetical protein